MLRAGTKPEDAIDREPFRLDPACLSAPSRFGFDLLIGERCLRYEFAVTVKGVFSEELGVLNGDEVTPIFVRKQASDGSALETSFFPALELSKEDAEFVRFKARDTLENQLFLSAVRGRKFPVLEEVGRWFSSQLVLLDPHCDFRPVEVGLMHAEAFKSYCIESLDKAGTGICGMENEPVAFESLPVPENVREDMARQLETTGENQMILLCTPDRTRSCSGARMDRSRHPGCPPIIRTKTAEM